MTINVENDPGAGSPLEQAQAEKLRNESQSATIAGALRLAQEQIEARALALSYAEAELAKRRTRAEELVSKAESLKVEALAIVQQAHAQADAIVLAAHTKAAAVLAEAADEATNLRKRGVADAEILRTEGRNVLGVSAEIGEQARRLPPEPKSGMDTLESIFEMFWDKTSALVGNVLSRHPEHEAAFAGSVVKLVGGSPQPQERPATAPARVNLDDVAKAVQQLGKERVDEILRSWGLDNLHQVSLDQAAELVALAGREKDKADGNAR